jgi:hypothetical protein
VSISHKFDFTWSNGGTPVTGSVSPTGDTEDNREFTVAGTTTDQQVALAFTKTKLQAILISSDQTVTLYTNDLHSGTPQDTITITANKPFVWYTGSGIANPFGGNVSTSYWSNAGASTATVKVKTLSQFT